MVNLPVTGPPVSARVGVVTTTVGALAQAQQLAHILVLQRLAACVQLEPITSVYRWEGAVHEDPEYRLVCKTSVAVVPRLIAQLQAQHPYNLPQVLVREEETTDAYAQWVEQETCEE